MSSIFFGPRRARRLESRVCGNSSQTARSPPGRTAYSIWELLEHMRIAQWDILEFSRDPKHVSPEWPAGYWPATPSPPNAKAWEKSLKLFARDLAAMKKLVANTKTDLFARIPHGTGQTILREALLVADHNSYHLGQVVTGSPRAWSVERKLAAPRGTDFTRVNSDIRFQFLMLRGNHYRMPRVSYIEVL